MMMGHEGTMPISHEGHEDHEGYSECIVTFVLFVATMS
jgi:hypothetical protein